MLLDHGSEVNLNGGRAKQKVVLQTLMTTSIHYNVVSDVVENYISDWILNYIQARWIFHILLVVNSISFLFFFKRKVLHTSGLNAYSFLNLSLIFAISLRVVLILLDLVVGKRVFFFQI